MLVVALVLESAACLALLVLCLPLFESLFALVVGVHCWLLVLVAARFDLAARSVLLGRVLLVVDLLVL